MLCDASVSPRAAPNFSLAEHRPPTGRRVLDIEPVETVPYIPLSHPFIERLIGSVRREFLNQTLFWNSLGPGAETGLVSRLLQREPNSQLPW